MKKLILSNSSVGTHYENITRNAESAISIKYLLGKIGSTQDKIDICGSSDLAIGVITDEAGIGEDVNVALLGAPDTLNVVASGSISAGTLIVPDSGGKVKAIPAAGESDATYNVVGIALTSASSDGDIIEFVSCVPQQHVVAAS